MTPQEKAQELYDKFDSILMEDGYMAKRLAMVVVDEVIALITILEFNTDYWNEVRKELESL